ncbi:dATP/dGTP diphosphohydrolase domain-containing protein [Asaia prunellae]|uniref:dATP/dGTP diphosphohydrolase domain-containing protein n=1 Tax=Asaia prunellae TaxID=610245 RepID=UPI00046F9A92|nr:dATP/dGTP diphosphohydrolase domain-containing protein [Asaia prunellae]
MSKPVSVDDWWDLTSEERKEFEDAHERRVEVVSGATVRSLEVRSEDLKREAVCVPEARASGGLRYNEGKLRYDLLPPDAVQELVEVLTKGAQKYPERNWEKGMDWSNCLASLKRHLASWEMGTDNDAETGRMHMAHVMWNAMALVTYALRGIGTDDRPQIRAHTV